MVIEHRGLHWNATGGKKKVRVFTYFEGRVSKKRLMLSCGPQKDMRGEDLKSERNRITTGGQMEEGRTRPLAPHIRYPELDMFIDINLELQTRLLVTLL